MNKAVGIFLAVTTVLVLFPFALAAEDSGPNFLAGILEKDDRPHGCVDCHVSEADAVTLKVNLMLAKVQRHPKVDALLKTLPNDCGMCHKEGAKMGPLPSVVHKAHFAKKADSQFIKLFQGTCLYCHTMDLASGVVSIKSGPKNW